MIDRILSLLDKPVGQFTLVDIGIVIACVWVAGIAIALVWTMLSKSR